MNSSKARRARPSEIASSTVACADIHDDLRAVDKHYFVLSCAPRWSSVRYFVAVFGETGLAGRISRAEGPCI